MCILKYVYMVKITIYHIISQDSNVKSCIVPFSAAIILLQIIILIIYTICSYLYTLYTGFIDGLYIDDDDIYIYIYIYI